MEQKDQKTNIENLLIEFRNKGAAWQSQHKANKLLKELRPLISENDWWELKISHSHYLTGEGAEELYIVCKELTAKYCGTHTKKNGYEKNKK